MPSPNSKGNRGPTVSIEGNAKYVRHDGPPSPRNEYILGLSGNLSAYLILLGISVEPVKKHH